MSPLQTTGGKDKPNMVSEIETSGLKSLGSKISHRLQWKIQYSKEQAMES